MAITAAALPENLKQDLLRQLEEQIGWSKYNELVNALGEDGLIDLILQKMQEAQNNQPTPRSSSGKWREWGGEILSWVLILGFWALVAVFPPLIAVPLLINLYVWVRDSCRSAGIDAGGALAVTVVLIVGIVAACFAVYWVAIGMGAWFKWLGGHF